MTKDDDQAPASKTDIRMLMEQMGAYYDKTEDRIATLEENLKEWKEEIKRHFDVVVEDIRHDLQGANRDEIESTKDRVTRLEQRAGIAPA